MVRFSALLFGLLVWCAGAGAQQDRWDGHMAAGETALQKRDFAAARHAFEAALTAAAALPPLDRRWRVALTRLAAAEIGRGAYGRARPLLEQALDIWMASEAPSDPELAATLNHLARVYGAGGEPAKARQRLRWALAIQEKLLPAKDPAIARTREALAGPMPAGVPRPTREAAPTPKDDHAAAPRLADRPPGAARGGYAVQLASYRSEEGARTKAAALRQALPGLLGARDVTVRRVALDGRGTFYRLLAGGFAGRAAARGLCDALKARDQDCLVVRDKGP